MAYGTVGVPGASRAELETVRKAAQEAQETAESAKTVMKAAAADKAGAAGLVPAPAAGAEGKYLRGDGTWQTPPDTNTTYSAATQSASGLMSAADKKKLDGVAAGANAYSLPAASATTRGGVKTGYAANGKNYPVQLADEKMYVNVPWTDTNTTYSAATQSANGLMSAEDKKKLDGVAAGANAYSLPAASASARGGVRTGYAANGKNYPVQLAEEKMFVNVPWTDTNTTYANMKAATASAAGAAGLVPAPAAGAQGKYLRGDGTWQTPPDTNTTYTPASAAPKAAGTAAVGTSAKYAREDHVHPAQTSVSGASGSCTGNAATATKLQTARTINGTSFNGSANITTSKWGEMRRLTCDLSSDGVEPGIDGSRDNSLPVSGVLPIKHGGTGNTTGAAVDQTARNAAAAAQNTANAAMPITGGVFTGTVGVPATQQGYAWNVKNNLICSSAWGDPNMVCQAVVFRLQ